MKLIGMLRIAAGLMLACAMLTAPASASVAPKPLFQLAKQVASLAGTTWQGSYQYDTMNESEALTIDFLGSGRARAHHLGATMDWTYSVAGNRVVLLADTGSTWTALIGNGAISGTMNFPGHGGGHFSLYQQTASAPPVGSGPGGYDLSQLSPDVRNAVVEARAAETRALETATRARRAANDAVRGRAGAVDNGLGYEDYTGVFAGDRYAGEYRGGYRTGVGVMYNAQNQNNTVGALRYEGDWLNGESHGLGAHYWTNNERHAGNYSNNMFNGPGVYNYSDGSRYEGQWANNNRSGYGVLWDAQGRAVSAGVWAAHEFVRPQ